MLGWNISVYRQADGGGSPARQDSPKGPRLAIWQARVFGLQWLDALVKQGLAINLGGNGYPFWYTAQACYLTSPIVSGPPDAMNRWIHDPGDVITEQWLGKTTIDQAVIDACNPDEWLLVVVWDES